MEGSCNLRLSLTFRLVALSLFLARGLTASDPQALFEKARALELSGDWAAAEAAYREYLRHTPASPEALSNLGVVLAQQQKYDEAVRFYRRALRLRPALLQIHLNMGLACYKAGKPSAAVDHFNAYLRHDPTSRQARQLLATSLLESDRYEEAARNFRALLPTEDPTVQLGLATAYVRLKRTAEAERILEGILQNQDSPEIQLLVGQAHLAENRSDEAIASLRRALQLNPSLPGATQPWRHGGRRSSWTHATLPSFSRWAQRWQSGVKQKHCYGWSRLGKFGRSMRLRCSISANWHGNKNALAKH